MRRLPGWYRLQLPGLRRNTVSRFANLRICGSQLAFRIVDLAIDILFGIRERNNLVLLLVICKRLLRLIQLALVPRCLV